MKKNIFFLVLIVASSKATNAADIENFVEAPQRHAPLVEIKHMLDSGIDINVQLYRSTALDNALIYGYAECAELLLQRGARFNPDVFSQGVSGAGLRALHANGIDLNQKDSEGSNALLHAVNIGDEKAIRYLISIGVDITVVDSNGNGVLTTAIDGLGNRIYCIAEQTGGSKEEYQKITEPCITWLKVLIKKGCAVNVCDKRGMTPLMYAAYHRIYEVIEVLLAAGAHKGQKDLEGKSAFDYCCNAMNPQPGSMRFLLNHIMGNYYTKSRCKKCLALLKM